VAGALVALGRFQEANQMYRVATQAAPENAAIRAEWGMLMADRHNPGEAEGLFREALKLNSKQTVALVGLAELAAGKFESQAPALLQTALEVNPNLAEARLLLVRVALEQENYQDVNKELEAVEKLNPRLLEAWSLRATSEYLQGKTDAAEKELVPRILAVNASYGEVFADLGDFHVLRRQYGPAVEFYRRALERNPELHDARSNLGINLLRLGEEAEARRVLEEAYRRDASNIWTVNTLRLMDSFANFDSFETDRFRVKLHKKESALLRPYVEEILNESLESITKRYGYVPLKKVVFEMYPDHEDFAVRTLGLPGLGALGASFGPVVAMDSPSARPLGEFHWGSTLWHELAHVITLGMTSNKVPRWFTEGLSVYEEARARPGWGDPMNLGLIQALQKHGLVPIEKLNGVFVRPQYPNQVAFAYFQSGMICEFIAEKYGFPKIVEMLRAYDRGENDAGALSQALGLTLEEFDKAFKEYAREKTYGFGESVGFGEAIEVEELVIGEDRIQPEARSETEGGFLARLRAANELKKAGKPAEAIAEAEAAKKLFPPYIEEGNPYELLAEIYEEQGQKDKAATELMAWRLQRGRDPKTFKKLAELLEASGRRKEAIQTLEEALQVSMYDVGIHERLGSWHLEEGNAKEAVREYRAALSLNPADRAEAHYQLAMAYQKLADARNARREILSALEIAPGYRPAQQLLLELTGQ
jgi:tetratricopeptide (TPR) repeat protein